GHRPAFGGQSRPHRPGTRAAAPHETATQSHQAKTHEHRAAKKNRKLEKRLSHHRIQRIRPLTRIRSPAPSAEAIEVSIHAPAKGATTASSSASPRSRSFDPRPREGGDHCIDNDLPPESVSIHAPAKGATNRRRAA